MQVYSLGKPVGMQGFPGRTKEEVDYQTAGNVGCGGTREEAGFFVFDTCKQFTETVPSIPRDQRDMDDVDTDAEDHIADESRYRCMTPRYGLSVEQV